jgi:hypothetical protein
MAGCPVFPEDHGLDFALSAGLARDSTRSCTAPSMMMTCSATSFTKVESWPMPTIPAPTISARRMADGPAGGNAGLLEPILPDAAKRAALASLWPRKATPSRGNAWRNRQLLQAVLPDGWRLQRLQDQASGTVDSGSSSSTSLIFFGGRGRARNAEVQARIQMARLPRTGCWLWN